jgi:hypothetical protein
LAIVDVDHREGDVQAAHTVDTALGHLDGPLELRSLAGATLDQCSNQVGSHIRDERGLVSEDLQVIVLTTTCRVDIHSAVSE